MYKTISGDTWDSIAFRLYGSEMVVHQLIQANLQHASIVIFSAGIMLETPEIDTVVRSDDVPPWMR
ncbi:MAG: tail protein X [Solibacillus sp.]